MTSPTISIKTDFPGGNAKLLELHDDRPIPEIHFAALPKGSPVAIWFCLEIEPANDCRPELRCVLHGIENLLGYRTDKLGLRPVFRTASRDWARVGEVAWETAVDGQLRVSWIVPGNQGRVRVALSFPYGQEELARTCRELQGVFSRDLIGLTSAGRELVRLANQPGQLAGGRPGIYCLARQHAAEAPGSWVLDGLLRGMAEAGTDAPLTWAVPLVDPDGIAEGRPGKDSFPYDFNRAWGSKLFPPELQSEMGTHPMRYETGCIQRDLCRWRDRCKPLLILDFHAPCVCDRPGIYCFLRDLDEAGRPDQLHTPWIEAIKQALDPAMRAETFVRSGRYSARWNTARVGDFANQALGLPEITFETPYAASRNMVFQRDDYLAAGRQIALGLLARIRALNLTK